MSNEIGDTLKLMALGRPFQLGMLYNGRSDAYNNSNCNNISTEDTFEEKSAMLGINAELKLSVLAGLVKVSGAANYVNDRKETELIERLTLKYSTTTRFDQLTMAHLGKKKTNHPEVFDQQIATHVVTGVLYGAEAFFILDRLISDSEDRTEVHGSVKAALNKITKIRISGSGEVDLTDDDKKDTDKLTYQFYGDFN
ncbi:unnamed protein product, partial [Didymodactylos carnosus]